MHRKASLFFLLFFCLLAHVYAQPRCGFEIKMEELRKTIPDIDQQANRQVQEFVASQQKQTNIQSTLYYVPVVVHVIHTGGAVGTIYNPGNAVIMNALNYLNAVFDGTWSGAGGSILGVGDIQLQFVLATRDPENNPTTGINHINA